VDRLGPDVGLQVDTFDHGFGIAFADPGSQCQGGAYSYLINGRMRGGFSVVGWPVVMTFIVN